jgi:glycosyltransferase involved in cell wall biosynthesis
MPDVKKNVCLLIDNLTGGGAEKKVLIIAEQMVSMGHDAHVVMMNDLVAYPIPEGVQTHALYPRRARNLDQFWRISRTARDLRAKIDELQARHGRFHLYLSNLDRTNKIVSRLDVSPVYFVMRNSVEEELARARRLGPFQYYRMLSGKKAVDGKDVITVSHGLEREILEVGRLRPRSIRTILNPFDFKEIRRRAEEPVAEIPREPYLLHVGRFARQKRHDILFQALRHVDPSYKLALLCKQRDKVLRCAEKYGVGDRVIAPGFHPNPYPWMKQARLTVLSSDFEGFVNVVVESMICGTPAVSTRCPHSPDEILTGPLARWLVPRRDPAALAERINEALVSEIDVGHAPILDRVAARQIARQYLDLAD